MSNKEEQQYLDILEELLDATPKGDRTGTGTNTLFCRHMRFDLSKSFPLLTTKKVHFKSIVVELLWFLSGNTNVKYLSENGVRIWDDWFCKYDLNREYTFVDKITNNIDYPYHGDYTYDGIMETCGDLYKLTDTWYKMMKRCYDVNHELYPKYGAKGVQVHSDWHDCSKFIEDVQKLPHWKYKLTDWNNFELDKDYYGANLYSKDTCVWLRHDENVKYTSSVNPILFKSANSEERLFLSLSHAANELGIHKSTLHKYITDGVPSILKRDNKKFIGCEFKYKQFENKLLRLKLIDDGEMGLVYGSQWRNFGKCVYNGEVIDGFDQMKWLVNEIKTNPDSRRLLVWAWNPKDHADGTGNAALPPCHMGFQVVILNGKLNLVFTMRSNDFFLGNPFNIASYALLAHMLALDTGYEVGELVFEGHDVHLYQNHIEQAKLQLSREPMAFPQIKINKRDSIFDYELEDFELVGYESHPGIKAPIAV